MPRVRSRVAAHARHKKVLELASGHRGKRHTNYKVAHESVMHALRYATEHRRDRKGDFRRLWIVRINAACRSRGTRYSELIHGLQLGQCELNRKSLAEMAVHAPEAFDKVVEFAKKHL